MTIAIRLMRIMAILFACPSETEINTAAPLFCPVWVNQMVSVRSVPIPLKLRYCSDKVGGLFGLVKGLKVKISAFEPDIVES